MYLIYSLTSLKNAKCYGKRKMFSIVIRQSFTFSPAKLSIFKQSLFDNSLVILISLAKKHEKINYCVLISTKFFFYLKLEKRYFICDFSANTAIFGGKGWRIFCFIKLCCSRSYYFSIFQVSITKKIIYHIINDFLQF